MGALAVTRDEITKGLATLDPDPVRAFAMSGSSIERAILRADNGASCFPLLVQALANPVLAPLLPPNAPLGTVLLAQVTDPTARCDASCTVEIRQGRQLPHARCDS